MARDRKPSSPFQIGMAPRGAARAVGLAGSSVRGARRAGRGLVGYFERRRLDSLMGHNEMVTNVPVNGRAVPALKRKSLLWLARRELGPVLVLAALALSVPVVIVGAGGLVVHFRTIARRQKPHRVAAVAIVGLELIVAVVVVAEGGLGSLTVLAALWALLLAWTTWLAWVVDMEAVTTSGRLVRTTGLWMLRQSATPALKNMQFPEADAGAFDQGRVTFDTQSNMDMLLHGWGWVRHSDQWVAMVQHEAARY